MASISRRGDPARSLEDAIESWEGEGVVCRRDREAGAWVFVALHDATLGPATGGTRMRAYPDPAAALEDGMRLAEGMTAKWAILDLPFGGGKCVLAPDRPLEGAVRDGLLRRYGALLETMNGAFQTGVDLGTTPRDMAVVAESSRHVHGVDPSTGGTVDPGPFTARGVLRAIEAALETAFGSPDPAGREVLVQGLGDVGDPLARMLADAGARLLVCDVDAAKAEAISAEVDARVVDPDDAIGTPCDVFAPCAVGGVLDHASVERLACRIVAGSANAQLASDEVADRLHRAGILYAPDYVANGGGAALFGLMALGGSEEAAFLARVDAIGETLREIFGEAARTDATPLAAAERIVRRRLAEAGARAG